MTKREDCSEHGYPASWYLSWRKRPLPSQAAYNRAYDYLERRLIRIQQEQNAAKEDADLVIQASAIIEKQID